jgi:hypothetical protein
MSLDYAQLKVSDGKIEVTKSALPDGASTEAKQDSVISGLQSIDLELEKVNSRTVTVGNQAHTLTTNPMSQDLLAQILDQLKINNAYLAEWQGYENRIYHDYRKRSRQRQQGTG